MANFEKGSRNICKQKQDVWNKGDQTIGESGMAKKSQTDKKWNKNFFILVKIMRWMLICAFSL